MTDLTGDFDVDHAPFVNNAHLNRTGWNPDAVAPPMKGGVYHREASTWPNLHEMLGWGVVIVLTLAGLVQLAIMNASHIG